MKYPCRVPGPKSRVIISRDKRVTSPSYEREYSFVFEKAKGVWVWDVDGRRYLDFVAGIAVNNVGHANPEVVKAMRKQANKGLHAAFTDFYAELPVRFIETLLELVPKNFTKAFLSNSGTEAVEAGYKLARWHSRKKWVIAFENSFHGRTMGSLSMTKSKPVQRDRFSPFLPVRHVPFPYPYRSPFKDEEKLVDFCIHRVVETIKKLKNDVAGIFVEPIQGEGGYIVPPDPFHKELRKVCTEEGILLCDDEVQTGNFRTGPYLAMEGFGVKPDIVTLSKAIGGGVPLGATLASSKIMDWKEGTHSNTFGGNLLACAGGIATLRFMRKKRLGENARKIGKHMLKILEEMKEKNEIIGDVRGKGLMIGVEIVKDKKSKRYGIQERHAILCRASEKGLILLPAGKSVIRISPPLILTKEQAEKGLDIFEDAVKMVR